MSAGRERIRGFWTGDGRRPGEKPEPARVRTRGLAVREGMLWSVMWGLGDFFVAPFAIFLRAGTTAMAVLGTAPLLLGPLASVAGAAMVERAGRRRPLIVLTAAIQAASFLPMLLLPLLFPGHAVVWVIVFSTIGLIAAGLCAPAWTSLMGDVTDAPTRGSYLGHRNRLVILAMFATLMLGGVMMAGFQRRGLPWAGFILSFSAAAAARAFCVRLLARHYDPPLTVQRSDYFSFWDFIRRTPHSNFAKFTWFVALMNGAVNISGPFFNVYMLRDLEWDYLRFSASTGAFLATQFMLCPWWGQQIDRYGARAVLRATALLLPALPVVWAFTESFSVILGAQVLSGCAWSGFNLAVMTFLYDSVTPPKRARAMSYHGVLNGSCSFLGGTVVGATLAAGLPDELALGPVRVSLISNLPAIFLISGLLRAMVLVVLFPLFREVREPVCPVRPHLLLWRMTMGEPVLASIGPWVSRTLGWFRPKS